MRIVFMGTPDFAVPTLKALVQEGHEVAAVVTQPDKPVGRKKVLTPPPVKVAALEQGIPVFQPSSINKPEIIGELEGLKPDIAVVLAFGQILRQAALELFPLGCINVHGSLLPKYRGAAPVQRAIIAGETVTGVTIMRMDQGLDTGPILLMREIPIGPDTTSGELFLTMAEVGASAMIDALGLIDGGQAVFTPQPVSGSTYASKLTEAGGCIDWYQDAPSIHNLVRGMNPAPGASTCLDDLRVKVWRTRLLDSCGCGIPEGTYEAGTVVAVTKGSVVVQTGSGYLELLDVQPAGSKRMDAVSFANGKRLNACSCKLSEPGGDSDSED